MDINELNIIFLSLKVALFATLFNLPFVLVFGWILARKKFFGKVLLEGFLHRPLVLPPVTIGYLLLLIFGIKGVIGETIFELFGIPLTQQVVNFQGRPVYLLENGQPISELV